MNSEKQAPLKSDRRSPQQEKDGYGEGVAGRRLMKVRLYRRAVL